MLKNQVEDIRGRLLEAKLQNVRLKSALQSRAEQLNSGIVSRHVFHSAAHPGSQSVGRRLSLLRWRSCPCSRGVDRDSGAGTRCPSVGGARRAASSAARRRWQPSGASAERDERSAW
jgi:hypothetical protein